ncbi:M16 family metallopeptidase [Desulfurivibrio dismutans]|uniref:M16 family metallopeptidase n=1 Tax=Desulfurivibrio dismutans TaxID=1398908 RepID=UPI0023DAC2CF|nr:pitrilysin family protein [Desulfurivibrio alkaliphilus]MDF1615645.1 pitrilysin family protein [Desulfurivibrio alkaliphilus]
MRIVTEATPSRVASVGFWVQVGARDEHDLTNGCSHFVEHMLFKGTQRRAAHQIAREFDVMGGTANAFTSTEATCYHATVLAERLPQLVDLLTDMVLNSNFAPAEVEHEREVILQEIAMVEDTPDDLVHDLFNRQFWGRHTLGNPVLGLPRVIGALPPGHIRDFHRRHYQPSRIVIAAAGQVDHQHFCELCRQGWDQLAAGGSVSGGPDFSRQPPVRPQPSRQIINRDLEQAHLVLGVSAPAENAPERYALHLLNTVLGGNMSSRLFQEIREKRGLAYAVFSYVNSHSDSGALAIYLGIDPRAANEALAVVGQEVRRLGQQRLSDEELAEARDYARAVILLAEENMESRMARLARNIITHGRPLPLEEILGALKRVSAEDIRQLATELFARPLSATALGPVAEDDEEALDWRALDG